MAQDWIATLKVEEGFECSFHSELYKTVPDDHVLLITDIQKSTKAIERGLYKEVNALGAAGIIASINSIGSNNLAFVFGGDGCTLLFHESFLQPVLQALKKLQFLAWKEYQLVLRVGYEQSQHLINEGFPLLLLKWQSSPQSTQFSMLGSGVDEAERRIKLDGGLSFSPNETKDYPDLSGFECRWDKVSAQEDMVLSLIVKIDGYKEVDTLNVYHRVYENVLKIIKPRQLHPLTKPGMRATLNPRNMSVETIFRTSPESVQRWEYGLKLFWYNIVGKICALTNWTPWETTWDGYKNILIASSDFRKMDGYLRMVIRCTKTELSQIKLILEEFRHEEPIVFGMHTSKHALITCMIVDRLNQQTHFIDGADGGYALAAKEMKRMMREG